MYTLNPVGILFSTEDGLRVVAVMTPMPWVLPAVPRKHPVLAGTPKIARRACGGRACVGRPCNPAWGTPDVVLQAGTRLAPFTPQRAAFFCRRRVKRDPRAAARNSAHFPTCFCSFFSFVSARSLLFISSCACWGWRVAVDVASTL